MADILQLINDGLRVVMGVFNFFPYWTSTFFLFLGTFWLHWKVRRKSTLTMLIGYGISTGSMGYSYIIDSFGEYEPGSFHSPPTITGELLEMLSNAGFLGFWVGVIGLFWFVWQVRPSKPSDSPNKSLNADAGDAGAG